MTGRASGDCLPPGVSSWMQDASWLASRRRMWLDQRGHTRDAQLLDQAWRCDGNRGGSQSHLERVQLRQAAAHAQPSGAGGDKPLLHLVLLFLLRTEEEHGVRDTTVGENRRAVWAPRQACARLVRVSQRAHRDDAADGRLGWGPQGTTAWDTARPTKGSQVLGVVHTRERGFH